MRCGLPKTVGKKDETDAWSRKALSTASRAQNAEMLDANMFSASGAAFRLQLHPEILRPEPEVPGIGMLKVKHTSGFRRLPAPRAGSNPVGVAAWSARPPPLPFLAAPAQVEQDLWAPKRCPSRLGSARSRTLLETYRASQPGCRPRPPRRSADDYRAASLAALCSGAHDQAALQLTTALQLQLSISSKQQECHLVIAPGAALGHGHAADCYIYIDARCRWPRPSPSPNPNPGAAPKPEAGPRPEPEPGLELELPP